MTLSDVPRYGIAIFWSDEDGQWIGTVPDLKGCSASGDRPEEALKEVRIASELWLESESDHFDAIPRPSWRPDQVDEAP